jgi:hypothetical protein
MVKLYEEGNRLIGREKERREGNKQIGRKESMV